MTSRIRPSDPAGVRAWLTDLGLAPVGDVTLSPLGAGQSNLTFRVHDRTGHQWVLRMPPAGPHLDSAHDVLREARIMSALGPTPVPVPHVHGTLEDPPAFLMSCVEGVVLDSRAALDATPHEVRRTIGLSLVRTLGAVHAVDLDATGLSTLASHAPYAERQLRRWTRQWEASRTRDLPTLDALTERLRAAVPPQRETTLVHGDGHVLNVVTAPGTGEVVALLDWELSTLGEPLADLGTLLAYWPQAGEPAMQHLAPSQHPGFATRDDLVEAYATATGRDVDGVGFWHVLGLWKVAIIAEGILHRAQAEPAPAAQHEFPRERIDVLVEHAHQVATDAGF
ncbi:aminoglycoside phosphotransferase (APT) family kinase protein [Nocardioides sp. J9]|uniref:phosphotransferase family protein n=1 Tax=Nocardioides sp. J9 TaxID=935844 RepID=UPI0011A9343B|nr:phosphotransferase family protein [Nocardioides sp. J9]TWH02689.1 aminoglycoside phosphotransferase (APT) family kinase protein [Nocardioides sp. J9]